MIEFEEAGFSYGGRAVLADVTLALAPGSFHFLVGPSGRGQDHAGPPLPSRPGADRRAACASSAGPFAPRDRNAIAGLRRSVGVVQQDCQLARPPDAGREHGPAAAA